MPKNTSIKSSIINLSNTTLGAGCLSLPFAFHEAGLGLGIIYLIIMCGCTILSLNYLLRARRITKLSSYEAIAVYYLYNILGKIIWKYF